jgi:circadian clock protein KaiB
MNSVSPIGGLIWGKPSPAIQRADRRRGRDTENGRTMRKVLSHGRNRKARGKTYVFRLFVAGYESNSTLARRNLALVCEKHLKGRYEIEIVDVLKDAATAYKHHVLLTPTLILIQPHPKITVVGNLSDTGQILAALRLIGDGR